MRRRDADDLVPFHGASETCRPVLVCLMVSVALHAALVVAAAALRSVRPGTPAPIHVTLVPGTGGDRAEGAMEGDRAPQAPARVPPRPVGVPQPVRANHERTQLAARPPHAVGTERQPAGVTVDVQAGSELPAGGVGLDNSGRTRETSGGELTGSGQGWSSGGGWGDGRDARAYCSYCPEPAYPLIARSRGWQGTVEVALSVRADGSVNGASLGRSSGYQALDDAAIAVARLSRFHLPGDGGVPTPLRGRMEYRFVLR